MKTSNMSLDTNHWFHVKNMHGLAIATFTSKRCEARSLRFVIFGFATFIHTTLLCPSHRAWPQPGIVYSFRAVIFSNMKVKWFFSFVHYRCNVAAFGYPWCISRPSPAILLKEPSIKRMGTLAAFECCERLGSDGWLWVLTGRIEPIVTFSNSNSMQWVLDYARGKEDSELWLLHLLNLLHQHSLPLLYLQCHTKHNFVHHCPAHPATKHISGLR